MWSNVNPDRRCDMRWKPIVHYVWLSATLCLGAWADPIQWQSDYLKLGRVDVGQGGWGVERSLGVTRGAAEFAMPIELVYRNTEDTAGLFGPQWRSPQLESRLIPKEKGVLDWKTPWGGEVVLTADRKDQKGRYADVRKEWSALENGAMRFTISRKDGWALEYNKGLLGAIIAPGGRKLAFNYADKRLASLEQVSKSDGRRWKLAELAYDAQGQLQMVTVAGVESRFAFDRSTPARLV